jgi:plastocyanin
MKKHYSWAWSGIILLFLLINSIGCSEHKTVFHKTYTVEIIQMHFSPAEIEVAKGDTIIFINHDMVVHNVTEADHGNWSSSPIAQGNSWKLIATVSASYLCTIHPAMKGKIGIAFP